MKPLLSLLLLVAAVSAYAETVPDWKITAEPAKKIMANFDTAMRISVNDGKGKPVTGATMELVVTMLDMDHGEHKSPTTMIAPGIYEGKVNFFMGGSWNLEVRVNKGSQSKAQKIRFDVKE